MKAARTNCLFLIICGTIDASFQQFPFFMEIIAPLVAWNKKTKKKGE